jgi:nitroreductase
MQVAQSILPSVAYEPLTLRQVVRKRRSAQDMDSQYGMLLDVFYQMLLKTLPTGGAGVQSEPCQLPFGALPWKAEVHLVLFVHRVVGLEQGIYILVRNFTHKEALQKVMRPEFVWEKPEGCPSNLPLYKLHQGDCRDLAARLSCHQVFPLVFLSCMILPIAR